jgi:hypothetical protein
MTNPIALKMAHPAELAQFVPLAFAVGRIFFVASQNATWA